MSDIMTPISIEQPHQIAKEVCNSHQRDASEGCSFLSYLDSILAYFSRSLMVKTVVVIFVEGETDKEFYQKLVKYIRDKRGGRLHCKVKYKNLKGVGNYKKNIANYLDQEVRANYPKATINAALCYDTDVFQTGKKPRVDWKAVNRALWIIGIKKIIHVKAVKSIEDWFLYDLDGLRARLKLSETVKIKQHGGLKEIQRLFRRAGETYIKGEKCKNLIKKLNFDVILPKIAREINGLIDILI